MIKFLFGRKKRIIEPKNNNEQLTKIIELLEKPSNLSTPSVRYEEQQLIEINKNKMQKLLEAQYTNRHNLDKLIITILFAEMGYLVHTIDVLVFLYVIPLIIGGIGVYTSIESYKYTTQALFYEEARKEMEIYDLLGIENFDNDYKNIDNRKRKIKDKLDFCEKIVYYCLMASTLTTVEALCFYKLGSTECSWDMFGCFLEANLVVFLITNIWSRRKTTDESEEYNE